MQTTMLFTDGVCMLLAAGSLCCHHGPWHAGFLFLHCESTRMADCSHSGVYTCTQSLGQLAAEVLSTQWQLTATLAGLSAAPPWHAARCMHLGAQNWPQQHSPHDSQDLRQHVWYRSVWQLQDRGLAQFGALHKHCANGPAKAPVRLQLHSC